MNLPKVHPAVNFVGFAAAVGTSIATFVVANQTCVVAALPEKYSLLAVTIIGAVATLLPTKKQPVAVTPEVPVSPSPDTKSN